MNAPFTDPAVTLTDYGLALECALIVALLVKPQPSDPTLRFWFVVFFAAAGAASLLGGTVHGFFKAANSDGRAILWPATLLSILLTSLAAWLAAARLELSPKVEQIARAVAITILAGLALIVLFVSRNFLVAIIGYLPSTLFLLYALVSAYRRRKGRALGWGVAGIVLTLAAAVVQQAHIVIHPVYFDHNAFYHVIQGAAFWMIYKAARFISTVRPQIRRAYAVTA